MFCNKTADNSWDNIRKCTPRLVYQTKDAGFEDLLRKIKYRSKLIKAIYRTLPMKYLNPLTDLAHPSCWTFSKENLLNIIYLEKIDWSYPLLTRVSTAFKHYASKEVFCGTKFQMSLKIQKPLMNSRKESSVGTLAIIVLILYYFYTREYWWNLLFMSCNCF